MKKIIQAIGSNDLVFEELIMILIVNFFGENRSSNK